MTKIGPSQTKEDTRSSVWLSDNEAHPKLIMALISSVASLWHHKLGHINVKVITAMMENNVYRIRHWDSLITLDFLSSTVAKKKQELYVENLITRDKNVTIHANRCRLVRTTACGGNRYFLVVTTAKKYLFMRKY